MAFYPNSYTLWKGKRLKIIDTIPLVEPYINSLPKSLKDLPIDSLPLNQSIGTVNTIYRNHGFVVTTGQGSIFIKGIQLEGKKVVYGSTIIQQLKPEVGIKLGEVVF